MYARSHIAENRWLVGRILARDDKTRSERWLRKQLDHPVSGKLRRSSVFRFKGLDAEAEVLTNIGDTARAFTAEHDLTSTNLLCVALARAK